MVNNFSSENTIWRCPPFEKRRKRARARWRRFNRAAADSFWRFWSLYGFKFKSVRKICLALSWDTPSFLANFRVEFTLVVAFLLIIPLERWIFLELLAVFSLFRLSLLPVSSKRFIAFLTNWFIYAKKSPNFSFSRSAFMHSNNSCSEFLHSCCKNKFYIKIRYYNCKKQKSLSADVSLVTLYRVAQKFGH